MELIIDFELPRADVNTQASFYEYEYRYLFDKLVVQKPGRLQ